MSADLRRGITPAVSALAGELQSQATPTRVAIVVVPAGNFDAAQLAAELVKTSGGAASVALLSAERIPSTTRSKAAPIDYRSTSARVWRHIKQSGLAEGTQATCVNFEVGVCNPPFCTQACNLPAVATHPEAFSCVDANVCGRVQTPTAASRPAASRQPPQSRAPHPITVTIATNRRPVFADLLRQVAREPDIAFSSDWIDDPALLLTHLEQQRTKLLLLDEKLLDQLNPGQRRMIRKRLPDVRVLLLADEIRYGLAEQILRNQFDGLLLAHCPPDAFIKAIRAVDRGEIWLPRALLSRAISEMLQGHDEGETSPDKNLTGGEGKDALTQRENQIVELLRQGFTNKEIGRRLGIMEDTVKKHLQNVFGKLGVRRRTLVLLHQASGRLHHLAEAHDVPL